MNSSKFVLIIGGGKVGFYLSRELLSQGNEVVLIERDKELFRQLVKSMENNIILGDGCEINVLIEAGIERADVVVATTGYDEDNYVICQIAKKKFGVPRTVSRLRDPKNEELFKRAGIDQTVSSTRIIFNILEQQIESSHVIPIAALQNGNIAVIQIDLTETSPACGKRIIDLELPKGILIISIIRNEISVIPQANTILNEDDSLIILMPQEKDKEINQYFISSEI